MLGGGIRCDAPVRFGLPVSQPTGHTDEDQQTQRRGPAENRQLPEPPFHWCVQPAQGSLREAEGWGYAGLPAHNFPHGLVCLPLGPAGGATGRMRIKRLRARRIKPTIQPVIEFILELLAVHSGLAFIQHSFFEKVAVNSNRAIFPLMFRAPGAGATSQPIPSS